MLLIAKMQDLGVYITLDQKSIPEQMADLIAKWMPDQRNTVFQHYFYNEVDPQMVPYYVAPPDEDAKAWEEALSKKPNEGAIPVLGRGFRAVAGRLETQAKAVEALQARLHEMNNSLTEMLAKHDLEITVRTTEAKRKHIALTKRCLALATKAQILRNRGYAMDPREEELRKKLMELEKKAFDPMLNGRQEEIWARMSAVRARARLLQEELDKLGKNAGKLDGEQLDEEHVKAIRKVSLPSALVGGFRPGSHFYCRFSAISTSSSLICARSLSASRRSGRSGRKRTSPSRVAADELREVETLVQELALESGSASWIGDSKGFFCTRYHTSVFLRWETWCYTKRPGCGMAFSQARIGFVTQAALLE